MTMILPVDYFHFNYIVISHNFHFFSNKKKFGFLSSVRLSLLNGKDEESAGINGSSISPSSCYVSWKQSLPHVLVATIASFLFGYHLG